MDPMATSNRRFLRRGILIQEFKNNTVTIPEDVWPGEFFITNDWFVHLSVYINNWRFVDLGKAFRGVVGDTVYSDVCASTMIGNKVKDLLREVRYKRVGRGSVYFGPPHIQYIPIRTDIVETTQT